MLQIFLQHYNDAIILAWSTSAIFVSHMKNVSLCNDQSSAGQMIVQHGKNCNVAIFFNTVNVINVKLCMVLLIELYLFIPFSAILTIFQVHSSVKQF